MPNQSRRAFIKTTGLLGLSSALPTYLSSSHAATPQWSVTGHAYPELAIFDTKMRDFMQLRHISGGALAVTYQGRLVYARGYTYTDNTADLQVQPTSLFRIASVSKPITAAAIFRLVEDKRLDLQDKLTDLLNLSPPVGQTADNRLSNITVLHLLQHLGGWSRAASGIDPMFFDRNIANTLDRSLPITKADIARFMTGQTLTHTPGTTYDYSNYGYSLLGQIIEQITQQSYASYVRNNVLAPLHIERMIIGRTAETQRLPTEVKYYSTEYGSTVLDNSNQVVLSPYGAWNLENMDTHGGWLASAVDIARFACAFDQPEQSPILTADSIHRMFALPAYLTANTYRPGDAYYGCGWGVSAWGDNLQTRTTWHLGSLPGTTSLLVRRYDGLNWCALFNKRQEGSAPDYGEIDTNLHHAANAVSTWPEHDLFSEYLNIPTLNAPNIAPLIPLLFR